MKKEKTTVQMQVKELQAKLRELRYKDSLDRKIAKARKAIQEKKGTYPLWLSGFNDCINLTKDLADKVLDLVKREAGK